MSRPGRSSLAHIRSTLPLTVSQGEVSISTSVDSNENPGQKSIHEALSFAAPATVQTTGATALVRPHYRDELPVLWFSIAALLFGWLLHVGAEATRDAPYFGPAVSQFTASATLGMLVFHIASRPGRKSILVSIALGGVLAFELLVQSERLPDATLFCNCLAIGLGLGSGLVLLRNAFSRDEDERTGARNALLPGLTLPLFALSSLAYLDLTSLLHPETYDYLVYRIDAGFGGQTSFLLAGLLREMPVLAELLGFVYDLLPLALVLVYAVWIYRNERPVVNLIHGFVYIAIAGFALYHLLPVAGPVYAFGSAFPFDPPGQEALSGMALVRPAWRNCVPSLHAAWALLVFWHCRPFRLWMRCLALVFLILTLLATLGLGLHYLYDLVVAVPFTLAIQAGCSPGRPKWRRSSLIAGVALTAIWIVPVRCGISDGVLEEFPWAIPTSAILTVALSFFLEYRLASVVLDQMREACEGTLPARRDRWWSPFAAARRDAAP